MKKLLNPLIGLLLVSSMAFVACNSEDGEEDLGNCYECTGADDGVGNTIEDATLCLGQDFGGTPLSQEDLDFWIDAFETLGGKCERK